MFQIMRALFFTILIILALPGLNSCEKIKGKGDVVSEIRNITGFNGLSLALSGTIFFTSDSVYYVEVQAQQNILDVLQIYVEGPAANLVIRFKPVVHVGNHEPIRIFIAAPDIRQMYISGSGAINVVNPMEEPYLETTISGSGTISIIELDATEFRATISGSGNIETSTGKVNYQHLLISGSGNINQVGVESDTTYATISGSGDISVWVNELLDVTISGSGNVMYKGQPVINSHISGSGSIIRI